MSVGGGGKDVFFSTFILTELRNVSRVQLKSSVVVMFTAFSYQAGILCGVRDGEGGKDVFLPSSYFHISEAVRISCIRKNNCVTPSRLRQCWGSRVIRPGTVFLFWSTLLFPSTSPVLGGQTESVIA